MIKTQIGLGVLSMPAVFDTFGIVPGIILLLLIAGITSWSDYMVVVFKLNHPEVYGIDDVGRMLFGRVGYEILGAAYTLCEYRPLLRALAGPLGAFLLRLDRLYIRRRLSHAEYFHRAQCHF